MTHDEYLQSLSPERRLATDRDIWRKLTEFELAPGHVRRQGLTLDEPEVQRLREVMPAKEGG
jgi:hypothetical protein